MSRSAYQIEQPFNYAAFPAGVPFIKRSGGPQFMLHLGVSRKVFQKTNNYVAVNELLFDHSDNSRMQSATSSGKEHVAPVLQ